MEILIAVAFYLGFAMLVGRFLSFSHRGEVLYPLPSSAEGPLPETAEVVWMPSCDDRALEDEEKKEAEAKHSQEPIRS